MLKSVQKLSTFKKCLKHYLLSDSVLVWIHCIWYIGITVVLCDFAVLPFFLCSFMFVVYLFFCVCVCVLLRWPAWWTFVFSGNLPQCCVLIELLYCGLIIRRRMDRQTDRHNTDDLAVVLSSANTNEFTQTTLKLYYSIVPLDSTDSCIRTTLPDNSPHREYFSLSTIILRAAAMLLTYQILIVNVKKWSVCQCAYILPEIQQQ